MEQQKAEVCCTMLSMWHYLGQCVWLRQLEKELGCSSESLTLIFEDNQMELSN